MKRRKNTKAIPEDWPKYLSEDQKVSLRMYESFGYALYFIRRPLFQVPTVVLYHEQEGFCLLNEEGIVEHGYTDLRPLND
jgi:hypothetical protein